MVSRVVLALLAFSSSLAAPALADSVPVAEAAECSEVFGDPQLRSARAARRAQLVELLVTEEGEVMLAHSQDWEEPLPLRLHGLHLTTVDVAHQQAIFELELPPLCVGLFRVSVDDELGQDAPILAVIGDAVVLELDGQLRYIQGDNDSRPPEVLWRSKWTLRRARSPVSVPLVPQPPPRRR